ncbi:MAG: hypothetical protein M3081_14780, partial [Gemmatimonadota bacterium]|nr:hypothetical protein [Gemmatimonadota bacterium]
LQRLRGQRADAVGDARGAREEHGALRDRAFAGLVDLLALSPEEIVGEFSDRHPIVLLPVRIETKFARVGQGTELHVRIFPDDISVAVPPSAVSDGERAAGQNYWAARANPADAGRNAVYQGAWTSLATAYGAYRASYIVRVTNPDAPAVAAPSEPPLARADALPDRFVILTYASGNKIHEVAGRAIPDDLVLVPDALQSDSWLDRDTPTGSLVVPPALKWLTDFNTAVDVGMAIRIPLQAPFDTGGFDRVVAIGVRGSTLPQAAPALVEGLLAKHRYGDGCGIARAGTPTNNTDGAKAGWQPPSGDIDQLFTIEDAPPDIGPKPGMLGVTDGQRLVELFGVSSELVRRLPNAGSTDIAEALAMNHAAAPGTIDDFTGEFLKTRVSPETAAAVHEFFVRWVTGRGHYPALRIGREPYGIVVTSAWDRWAYPQRNLLFAAGNDVAPALASLIRTHRPRWTALGNVASHAAQADVDPFVRLLSIIGLLASSSNFVSRTAVSDAYVFERLHFGGAQAASIKEWFDELKMSRDRSLVATGFPKAIGPEDPLIQFITFLAHTDSWRLPLVDRDPTVPLSERETIGTFDGKRNFLHWLSQASRADLVSESFIGGDGKSVSAPQALLYVLLRHSLLSAIESGSLDAARTFGSELFEVIDRDPLIANIGPAQNALRKDYLEIDASRLGLTKTATPLADWALTAARMGGVQLASNARLADVHNAIAALASVPTARLERLLTEHTDLCSYRLDAWITALYSQRLAQLQGNAQEPGYYIGAYGWVENLRPATGRARIPADTLPPALRKAAGQNLFEDGANGGFVHAPSLMQAVTASVLRNAYLSHASAELPTPFSVNLSSARMRAALALTEGVRGGQPIAALLGYQIERGLHERHPGIELDEFIYALRDRFPLVAGLLTDIPPGTSAEVIEARNVVHGLDLIEFTVGKAFPWGVAGLPAAGSVAATAIADEVERARDALDAVSDLLLSESVHQAVQGNVARTKASLQALTDPEAPPEPEVIRTPRSSNLLTFRVALALDVDAVKGWSAALSPRAKANAQLNHWLADHLPPPSDVQWSVRDGAGAPAMQSLTTLGIEPIDLVLMSGDRIGDRSSELERHLIRRFRADHAVPDERASIVAPVVGPIDAASTVVFDFSASSAGKQSLASVQPLIARLRRIITRARAADARDFWRNADMTRLDPTDLTGSATGDARLVGFKDLTKRIDDAATTLTAAAAALTAALATLAPLRTTLEGDASTVSNPAWVPALDTLRAALFDAEPYGLPEALPADGVTVSRVLIDTLITQGLAVGKLIEQRLAEAASLRATAFADPLPAGEPARSREVGRRNDVLRRRYLDAARALFGPAYTIVPLFHLQPDQSSELVQALAAPVTADALAMEEWLHSAARVRPRVGELTWAVAATRWMERPITDPAIAQLPHVPAGVPWIGAKIGNALPRGEWLSLALFGAPFLTKPVVAALMLDDWTENIPTARETTGVSFNFNRPNAVAPHAVLVAVPPVFRGNWEWEDLVGSVNEALNLAKVRAVDLDQLIDREVDKNSPQGDYFQLLPAILTEFSQSRFAHLTYAGTVAAALAKVVR